MRTLSPLHPEMYPGPPRFDSEGWYAGPLPRKTGQQLIGHDGTNFKTAASAAWPPQLCSWVADSILLTFVNSGQGEGELEGKLEEEKLEQGGKEKGKEEEDHVDPTYPPFKGGEGPARECQWKGQHVPFHDGGCLGSPGRWDPEKRKSPGGEWIGLRKKIRGALKEAAGGEAALERECFAMARGDKGCKLVKDSQLLERIRGIFVDFLGGQSELAMVAEGQPFRLRLIHGLLKEAGDQDCEFLLEAESGLPLGVLHELPRTPASFERQVKWALEDDPSQVPLMRRRIIRQQRSTRST